MEFLTLLAVRVSIPSWLAVLLLIGAGLFVLYTAVFAFFRPEVLINLHEKGPLAFTGQIVRGLPENLQGIGARIVSIFLLALSGSIFFLAYWQYDRSYGEYNRQMAAIDREMAILSAAVEERETDGLSNPDIVDPSFEPEPAIESLEVADAHLATASQAWEVGNRSVAIESAEKALRIYTHHLGPDHAKVAGIQAMLSTARATEN